MVGRTASGRVARSSPSRPRASHRTRYSPKTTTSYCRTRSGSTARSIPTIFPSRIVNLNTARGRPPGAHTAPTVPSTSASSALGRGRQKPPPPPPPRASLASASAHPQLLARRSPAQLRHSPAAPHWDRAPPAVPRSPLRAPPTGTRSPPLAGGQDRSRARPSRRAPSDARGSPAASPPPESVQRSARSRRRARRRCWGRRRGPDISYRARSGGVSRRHGSELLSGTVESPS
jgi:hypothetical protein